MSANEKERGPDEVQAEPSPTEAPKKREYKDFGHDETAATRKFLLVRVVLFCAAHSFFQRPPSTWTPYVHPFEHPFILVLISPYRSS